MRLNSIRGWSMATLAVAVVGVSTVGWSMRTCGCGRQLGYDGDAVPATVAWRQLDAGFEVAEMPVLVDGQEADRILLTRIDPAKFKFVLRHSADGGRVLSNWMQELGAVAAINGSFFAKDGAPDTPFQSAGVRSGPKDYDARHGAFVTSDRFTGIRDLRGGGEDWRQAFREADHAMVSYPLLLGPDGGNSAAPSDKRANRSFAAQDATGRIILGTTRGDHFTLQGLAVLLRHSPLDLRLALNLDGGPYACQGVAFNGYARDFCGMAEADGAGGDAPKVEFAPKPQSDGTTAPAQDRRLPIVMAVIPR